MPMPGISSKKYQGLDYVDNTDTDTVPLLGSYGSIKQNGRPISAEFSNGTKSDMIVATIGDKSVFITDLRGARELLNDHSGMTWAKLEGSAQTAAYGHEDDTIVVLSGDNLDSPWAGKQSRNGLNFDKKPYEILDTNGHGPGHKQSKEHSLIKDFLQFIHDFRFGGVELGDTSWRFHIPIIISGLLLILTMITAVIWVVEFRGGFVLEGNQMNNHPILMITGFFLFSGFSMLFYRAFRRQNKLKVKLLHTAFHLAAIIFVICGYVAIRNGLTAVTPLRPNFSTLHAWLGLATIVLFISQFILGFASFILATFMCDALSASWRAIFVPNHTTFGLITFVLAAATAVTGLTEKAIFTLQDAYVNSEAKEALYVNLLGTFIITATISIVFTLRDDRTKRKDQPIICNITQ